MSAQHSDGTSAHHQPLHDRNDLDSSQSNSSAPTRPRLSAKPTDVICGRGHHIVNHRGNLNLHLMVNEYREEYIVSKRSDKRRITRHVLDELKKSGVRFIRRVSNGQNADEWQEVDEEVAYKKVGHALRLRKKNESNSECGPMAAGASAAQHKAGASIDKPDQQKPSGTTIAVVSDGSSTISGGPNGPGSNEKSQPLSTEIAASSVEPISESRIAIMLSSLRSSQNALPTGQLNLATREIPFAPYTSTEQRLQSEVIQRLYWNMMSAFLLRSQKDNSEHGEPA